MSSLAGKEVGGALRPIRGQGSLFESKAGYLSSGDVDKSLQVVQVFNSGTGTGTVPNSESGLVIMVSEWHA